MPSKSTPRLLHAHSDQHYAGSSYCGGLTCSDASCALDATPPTIRTVPATELMCLSVWLGVERHRANMAGRLHLTLCVGVERHRSPSAPPTPTTCPTLPALTHRWCHLWPARSAVRKRVVGWGEHAVRGNPGRAGRPNSAGLDPLGVGGAAPPSRPDLTMQSCVELKS